MKAMLLTDYTHSCDTNRTRQRGSSRPDTGGAPSLARRVSVIWLLLMVPTSSLNAADDPDFSRFERSYAAEIRPLIQRYCYECHSGDEPEAELDFAALKS